MPPFLANRRRRESAALVLGNWPANDYPSRAECLAEFPGILHRYSGRSDSSGPSAIGAPGIWIGKLPFDGKWHYFYPPSATLCELGDGGKVKALVRELAQPADTAESRNPDLVSAGTRALDANCLARVPGSYFTPCGNAALCMIPMLGISGLNAL